MKDFLEWASLRAWVREWLKYCQWYYMKALYPEVTIEEFFKAPVVNQSVMEGQSCRPNVATVRSDVEDI
jgi:hypothetical protein